MNLATGVFTAPRTGKYFFSLSGLADFPISPIRVALRVILIVNGNVVGRSFADDMSNDPTDANTITETYSLQSTIHLQVGDRVWLEIDYESQEVVLYDSESHYTHFNGWLIEENVSQSLKK